MGERDCCPDGTVDAVGAITGGGLEATAVSVVESGFADDVAFGVGVCVFLGDTFLVEGAFFPSLIFLRFFGLVNSGSALDASFFAFKASTFSLSFCIESLARRFASSRASFLDIFGLGSSSASANEAAFRFLGGIFESLLWFGVVSRALM